MAVIPISATSKSAGRHSCFRLSWVSDSVARSAWSDRGSNNCSSRSPPAHLRDTLVFNSAGHFLQLQSNILVQDSLVHAKDVSAVHRELGVSWSFVDRSFVDKLSPYGNRGALRFECEFRLASISSGGRYSVAQHHAPGSSQPSTEMSKRSFGNSCEFRGTKPESPSRAGQPLHNSTWGVSGARSAKHQGTWRSPVVPTFAGAGISDGGYFVCPETPLSATACPTGNTCHHTFPSLLALQATRQA